MAYFDQDFISFFKELDKNNDREWFAENKKRYEKNVKAPFAQLVEDLIDKISELEEPLPVSSKDCIFRIHRDVRFSKDKSPYKVQVSALIGPKGRKDMLTPALYLEASHRDVRIYTGMYKLDKEPLKKVRIYLGQHSEEFREIINEKQFIKYFGEVRGEKNKRLPADMMEYAEREPLIYNKNYYIFCSIPPKSLLSDDISDQIMEAYKASHSFREFLKEGLS